MAEVIEIAVVLHGVHRAVVDELVSGQGKCSGRIEIICSNSFISPRLHDDERERRAEFMMLRERATEIRNPKRYRNKKQCKQPPDGFSPKHILTGGCL